LRSLIRKGREKVEAGATEEGTREARVGATARGEAREATEKRATGEVDFADKESGRFYSPLVLSIAKKESISIAELNGIQGTGTNRRVRKQDVLTYLDSRGKQPAVMGKSPTGKVEPAKVSINIQPGDQIVEMDRMRKLIVEHMVMSKQISAHVTTFVEADVTNLVLWREKNKDEFLNARK